MSPTTTLVALAPDQQPETVDEIRALLASAPSSNGDDADSMATAVSVEGALGRLTDGSLSNDDYFLGAGDYLPSGLVIASYLVCPMSLGEHCRASVQDYQRFVTDDCPGVPVIVSVVVGPNGPAGAGTCVWRPTTDQIAAARDVVHDALVAVVADATDGVMSDSEEVTGAAQAYGSFTAAHPFENPMTSNLDGADAVHAALQPFHDVGYLCGRTSFVDPIDDVERHALVDGVSQSVRTSVDAWITDPTAMVATWAGVGSAIGSGRLYVTWCLAARP